MNAIQSYVVALLLLVAPSMQAARDFLTAFEVDQLREAQDPNERLPLYCKFAQQRVDQLEQLVAHQRPGRSVLVHDLIEDYTKIIEAMDTVVDDALRRKLPLEKGLVATAACEQQFATKLQTILDGNPFDLSRYDFVLKQALDTTKDSIDLSKEDLAKRTQDAEEEETRRRKEREAALKPAENAEGKAVEQKKGEPSSSSTAAPQDPSKPARKAPTLRRKGEAAPQ